MSVTKHVVVGICHKWCTIECFCWMIYRFVMSVCLPFSMEHLDPPTGLILINFDIWGFKKKSFWDNSNFVNIWPSRVLCTNTYVHFWSYLAHFFLEWEMFQTKVVEKFRTHIVCSVIFYRISCLLWDNVEIFCKAGHATDDNMPHAHCKLDT